MVGILHQLITAGSILGLHTKMENATFYEVSVDIGVRTVFAIASCLYPLSGFVADIYVGHYRIIIFSLLLLLCGCISLSVGSVLYFSNVIESHGIKIISGQPEFYVVISLGFVLIFVGLSGYRSNYIQLGLDQLQDAPSYSLGLFIHAVEWFMIIGRTLLLLVVSWSTCKFEMPVIRLLVSLPLLLVLMLLVLMVVGWWKRKWFHKEPAQHNPYRTVIKVISFTLKRKYPIQFSSFTSSSEEQHSRLDHAKKRYGGPFTTEQVEDVKAFFKIIMILISLGPVFVLVVPAGLFFTKFVQHVTSPDIINGTCNNYWKWIIIDTGGLKFLAATVLFPIYIWLLYSVLRSRIPRIFTRLRVWIIILVICVCSITTVDLVGHLLYHHRKHVGAVCMLTDKESLTLHLPWVVVLFPATLQAVAPAMMVTTILEFITAQSPYSMRGLLVGIFFAIMGFFQFIGSLILLPFYLPHFWSTEGNAPLVNCGFGYLVTICTIGIGGFLLFLLASRRYRYRER
jgi:peptide/histidine transporter 3/4